MHCRKGQCIFPLDVTTIGKSGMYFAINKKRSDIKTELDYAMHQLDQDSPFLRQTYIRSILRLIIIRVLQAEKNPGWKSIQCVDRIMEMPAGTYDMILMDIQMPKMNGYKATQTIRHLLDEDKACIPIIAMTANAFEEDKREAIAAGMNAHIAKPIQVDNMLPILSEIIRQQEK